MKNNANCSNKTFPITEEQFEDLKNFTQNLSSIQKAWLSGYFFGKIKNNNENIKKIDNIKNDFKVTIISASQTGNATYIAKELNDILISLKIKTNLTTANEYNFKKIDQEICIILITSTHGEGEPPEEAINLHQFLISKRAPKLKNTFFSVFGLGDVSYIFFNKAAKDFDEILSNLGAKRLLDRVEADTEYEEIKEKWIKKISAIILEKSVLNNIKSNINIINNKKNIFNKLNPLEATILKNQKITGRFSTKDVRHIEIDLGDSNIKYYPGDVLGVWYKNDKKLVQEFIDVLNLNKNEIINIKNKEITIYQALFECFELTVNSPKIVKMYYQYTNNTNILNIIKNEFKLNQYAKFTPIIEMIKNVPSKIKNNQFFQMLRPLRPRLYSISSSQEEVNNEVHITVNILKFRINNKYYTGGASGYLADQMQENEKIKVFIENNPNFKLPINHKIPIIMIGAGTGIAPFRSFMQQRNLEKKCGKNWLFFGNPNFTEDFLYQIEWQNYIKLGVLNKIDLAWSQDQNNKIYVQDKIKQKSFEIWEWITKGANLYVCGNAENMAKDVENTLLKNVISKFGNMNIDLAKDFLNNLRFLKRYQRDIY